MPWAYKQSGHPIFHTQQGWKGPSVSNPRIPVCTWLPLGTHTHLHRIPGAHKCSWARTSTGILMYVGTVGHTFPQDPCVHMATVGNTNLHSSECSDPIQKQEEEARPVSDELGTKHACDFPHRHPLIS